MEKEKYFNGNGNGNDTHQPWNPIFGMGIGSEKSIFETGLSSFVSSPSHSHSRELGIPGNGNESIVLRELIGRLGSICGNNNNNNGSTNNSCYNTPLNSPPKLNLSIPGNSNPGISIPVNSNLPLAQFGNDPGFVERAARYSSFNGNSEFQGKLMGIGEESSVSEPGMKGQNGNCSGNGRKRKVAMKGKGKETQSSTNSVSDKDDDKVVAEAEKVESDAKRSKSNDDQNGPGNGNGNGNGNEKKPEPPKDYIHVRARRGQATDSHSLAERVRREKISERMKFLQDLVPGCNKVTGKAVMLDEIINYVQSLQRQVEFLSMKLATVNPRMDVSLETLLSKDTFRPQVSSVPTTMNPFDASAQPFPYGIQSQNNGMVTNGPENQFSMNPLMAAMHRNSIMKASHIDGFGEVSQFWENDLQSVVKMALGEDQPHGFLGHMKIEL